MIIYQYLVRSFSMNFLFNFKQYSYVPWYLQSTYLHYYLSTEVCVYINTIKTTFLSKFLTSIFSNYKFTSKQREVLKFGDSDGPNLCKVKQLDISSTFIENIFRSGLTLVSFNDIITIKIDKKNVKSHKKINKHQRLF